MSDAITRAEALLAAATPGPWEYNASTRYVYVGPDGDEVCEVGPGPYGEPCENGAIIAAAPTLLRELVDELARSEAAWIAAIRCDATGSADACAACNECLAERVAELVDAVRTAEAERPDISREDAQVYMSGRVFGVDVEACRRVHDALRAHAKALEGKGG